MTMPLESIEAEALRLSPEERSLLADRLIASIAPDFTFEAEWDAEVTKRLATIESGEEQTIPIEEALARARRMMA